MTGDEKKPALQLYAGNGCGFLTDGLCTLHGSGLQPLECRVCHHAKPGVGKRCHADIERDWNSAKGQALVDKWAKRYGIVERYGVKKQYNHPGEETSKMSEFATPPWEGNL